ncbi:MAG TPA: hypothetical protein VF062_15710 [Candidatus Limnocylindrales bacterium]
MLILCLFLRGRPTGNRREPQDLQPAARRWRHGNYPPPDGPEVGWYLVPLQYSLAGWLCLVVAIAAFCALSHAFNSDSFSPFIAALNWVWLAHLARVRFLPEHSMLGITPSGVYRGTELFAWDRIERYSVHEGKLELGVSGRTRSLGAPPGDAVAADVGRVIEYYLKRPSERANMACVDL